MLSIAAIAPTSFAAPARATVNMAVTDYAKSMPGTGPFGFFDPLGFMSSEDMTEGKARYFREVSCLPCHLRACPIFPCVL